MTRKMFVTALVLCLAGITLLAADPEVCSTCHEDVMLGTAGRAHMRVQPFEVQGHAVGCAGCHGGKGLDQHVDSGDPQYVQTYGEEAEGAAQACLSCHSYKGLQEWNMSEHSAEELTCSNCHTMHGENKPESACVDCHQDAVTQFRLPSHHPVEEGRMKCASCHDVHSGNEFQLKTKMRKNDLCLSCHPAQEGPFIFEHEPVLEDCMLCHSPHGSVADPLLVANEPTICIQCHDFHFHANHAGNAAGKHNVGTGTYRNPNGEYGHQMAFTTKCTQCHTEIHGSDLPSQSVSGQGRALQR